MSVKPWPGRRLRRALPCPLAADWMEDAWDGSLVSSQEMTGMLTSGQMPQKP